MLVFSDAVREDALGVHCTTYLPLIDVFLWALIFWRQGIFELENGGGLFGAPHSSSIPVTTSHPF